MDVKNQKGNYVTYRIRMLDAQCGLSTPLTCNWILLNLSLVLGIGILSLAYLVPKSLHMKCFNRTTARICIALIRTPGSREKLS